MESDMRRLFSAVLILVVATMCLPSDWTVAQESKQKCKECPIAQTAKTHEFEFEFPGVDFPLGIHVAFEHNETPGDQANVEGSIEMVEGCIEIQCECLKNSGIPFLSNVPMMGKLFTNVKQPSHPPCCAAIKSDSCDGQCCAIASDACPDACEVCEQESQCEKCDGCPSAKTGVPTKGSDHERLFTTAAHASSNSCQGCQRITKCEKCDDCPGVCSEKAIQDCQENPQRVELVGYVASSQSDVNNPPSGSNENVFELRIQNERLKMEVKAAENRLKMMEAMMEIREENAKLRTQVEFFKAHHGHSASPLIDETSQKR
jgi:hypothetical protein